MARTNIMPRHCQCKKCAAKGKRICRESCSHSGRYQVRKRMPDGSRPSRWFSSYRKAEMYVSELESEWRDQSVAEAITARSHPLSQEPFREVAEQWLAMTGIDTEPRTVEGYRSIVDGHLNPVFGDQRISDIKQPEVQSVVATWSAEHAPQTVRNRVNVLLPILRMGGTTLKVGKRHNGIILPSKRNDTGGTSTVNRRLFLEDSEELHTLIAAMPERYRLLIAFLGLVGCRPGEAMELRQSDIVNGQRLQISRAVKRVPKTVNASGYRVGDTKTHKARIVWCPPSLLHQLRDETAPPDALLFSEDGSWIDYNSLSRAFREARKALPTRLSKLRLYDLRHTCASVLANEGASILVVAGQLGHSDPSITATVYSHLFPSAVDALMGRVDPHVATVLNG